MRMERVNQILQHTLYQSCRRQIDEKEKDRIFCGHDMGHLLDVARLAWIFNLEANPDGLRILSGRDERDSLCDRKSPQQRDVKAG